MRRTPPRRPESVSFSCCFVGISLVALVLQLPTSFGRRIVGEGTCFTIPTYKTMQLRGNAKRSYNTGERIYFDCKPGYYYTVLLPRNTFCKADGTWYQIEEACQQGGCVALLIENGLVTYPQGGTEFGKDIHFYCDYGYQLVGKQILNCKFNGTKVFWDGDAPKCEKVFCKTPEKIKNGNYTNGHKDTFVFNEEITYSCDSPNGTEKYMLIGESTLTCMATGLWSSMPPQCKEITCDIPVLKHGRSVSERKEKYFYQDVIEFECLEGFLLNGSKSISCGRNNTWEPKMPTCIKDIRPTTHPTMPPASKYPDPGVSVLMLLTLFIIILVACICLCQFLRRRKKRLEHPPSVPGLPDQPSFSVGPSSGPPPTEPTEPPPSLSSGPPPEAPAGPPPTEPAEPPPSLPSGPPPEAPAGPPPGAPIKPPPGAPIKPPPGAPIKPPPGAPIKPPPGAPAKPPSRVSK
ncbi:membrane cofactor protein-like isoform X2 [Saccopteryx bilineata]|uniref:membrane cofactor protein-like isoform X2 n=1 Tax=Saccopteryx bilineata TaxID=59482 RepID=UPI00338DD784